MLKWLVETVTHYLWAQWKRDPSLTFSAMGREKGDVLPLWVVFFHLSLNHMIFLHYLPSNIQQVKAYTN